MSNIVIPTYLCKSISRIKSLTVVNDKEHLVWINGWFQPLQNTLKMAVNSITGSSKGF